MQTAQILYDASDRLRGCRLGKHSAISELAVWALTEERSELTMVDIKHPTMPELEAGIEAIRRSPADDGVIELLVRRPAPGVREVLAEGRLDLDEGLVGDDWRAVGSSAMPDGSANPEAQLTLMNARAIALLAQQKERWPLAGDQLYVDLDLSGENLPPGTRLAIGTAEVVVTAAPHTGCQQFRERFGTDALKFVNSPMGRSLNLRGINTRVVQAGDIRIGDRVKKLGG
jgi:MOSC domain-containing protein YiiM